MQENAYKFMANFARNNFYIVEWEVFAIINVLLYYIHGSLLATNTSILHVIVNNL